MGTALELTRPCTRCPTNGFNLSPRKPRHVGGPVKQGEGVATRGRHLIVMAGNKISPPGSGARALGRRKFPLTTFSRADHPRPGNSPESALLILLLTTLVRPVVRP
jgi:hypothetical protein